MQPLARRGVGAGERVDFRLGERCAERLCAAELLVAGEQALADQRRVEVAVVDAVDV